MDYNTFVKEELSKFRLVLNESGITGDEWREYMFIKLRLLKGEFEYDKNPLWSQFRLLIQPLVRMRNGEVVWYGSENGDFMTKVSLNESELITGPEKCVITPNKVTSPLQPIGRVKVYFPSENPEVFRPSAACVFQQFMEHLHYWGLLFEVKLDCADVRECYDKVLKCHVATVVLYYYGFPKTEVKQRAQALPTPEPEDLEVNKVREVNKVKEPEKPTKIVRDARRLR